MMRDEKLMFGVHQATMLVELYFYNTVSGKTLLGPHQVSTAVPQGFSGKRLLVSFTKTYIFFVSSFINPRPVGW